MLNTYVRTAGSSDESAGATQSAGISYTPGSNVLIHDVTSTYAEHNITLGGTNTTASNWQIYNCVVAHQVWGIQVSTGNTSQTLSGVYIYGNNVNNGQEWNDPSDVFHFDGIFPYGQGTIDGAGSVDNVFIYNNYIWGDWGLNGSSTSDTALTYANGNVNNFNYFNNIHNITGNGPNNASVYYGNYMSSALIANNTFVGNGGQGLSIKDFAPITSEAVVNNVSWNTFNAIWISALPAPFSWINYNYYGKMCHTYLGCQGGAYRYTNYFNLAQAAADGYPAYQNWQTVYGADTNGGYSDTVMAANSMTLHAGSIAIGGGQNLYGTCNGQPNPGLGALCFDATGSPRPSNPAVKWDAGAYQFNSAASNSLNPPTSVTTTGH